MKHRESSYSLTINEHRKGISRMLVIEFRLCGSKIHVLVKNVGGELRDNISCFGEKLFLILGF